MFLARSRHDKRMFWARIVPNPNLFFYKNMRLFVRERCFLYLRGTIKRYFDMRLIGREQEVKDLNRLYNSDMPQFVAIYGRRRVGKTFLVDETFKGRITFRHAGLSPVDHPQGHNILKSQLRNFYFSLTSQGMKKSRVPASWLEAFFMLEQHLKSIDNGQRQLIFLDELPWMDTPRSGFVTALEAFWNGWACHRDNIMLVVCGSASSWIQNRLINNHGGLYGRLTFEIKLSPFNLGECEAFYRSRGVRLSRYEIARGYMALGGVPYYLGYVEPSMSMVQNIDRLFFSKDAPLRGEFDRLFASVFARPEEMKSIVKVLSNRHDGYTRGEIARLTNIKQGGGLSKMLEALIVSDFVQSYVPFGHSMRDVHYKLVDPFCLFYLRHVAPNGINYGYWQQNQSSPSVLSWQGIAFEEICLMHIDQIKKALGIYGVSSRQSSWALRGDGEKDGTQIDLLIQRNDNVVNLCEMKFYKNDFAVDRAYDRTLRNRLALLQERLPKRVAVHMTLITTFGLVYNEYSSDFQQVILLDNLFE